MLREIEEEPGVLERFLGENKVLVDALADDIRVKNPGIPPVCGAWNKLQRGQIRKVFV